MDCQHQNNSFFRSPIEVSKYHQLNYHQTQIEQERSNFSMLSEPSLQLPFVPPFYNKEQQYSSYYNQHSSKGDYYPIKSPLSNIQYKEIMNPQDSFSSSSILPMSMPSSSPLSHYNQPQFSPSATESQRKYRKPGPTPPLTPPHEFRSVKRKISSPLLIKKSDGVIVNLLNDDDNDNLLSPPLTESSDEDLSNDEREKNFPCLMPGCTSKFSRQDNMMQHFRTHLSSKSRRGSKSSIRTLPLRSVCSNINNSGSSNRPTKRFRYNNVTPTIDTSLLPRNSALTPTLTPILPPVRIINEQQGIVLPSIHTLNHPPSK
ncbi:29_t:CDS:2 [Diversispora eburnea]|uniref:29_t:CDS:1 n=1 Tax=Diversispora eburnea TaxID=1213867 RepID=A0A9N8Z7L5_9GLOM|nr:29_t:CDS:2 [Diversispora eburnea]